MPFCFLGLSVASIWMKQSVPIYVKTVRPRVFQFFILSILLQFQIGRESQLIEKEAIVLFSCLGLLWMGASTNLVPEYSQKLF